MKTPIPSAGEAMPKTITDLYAEWQEQFQNANKSGLSEEERDRAADCVSEIAAAMISVPPGSVAEYAMKLDACTEHGAFPLRDELIDEVVSIAKGPPNNGAVAARKRLDSILNEAAVILSQNPDLNIDRVSIDKHGVGTLFDFPDAKRREKEA